MLTWSSQGCFRQPLPASGLLASRILSGPPRTMRTSIPSLQTKHQQQNYGRERKTEWEAVHCHPLCCRSKHGQALITVFHNRVLQPAKYSTESQNAKPLYHLFCTAPPAQLHLNKRNVEWCVPANHSKQIRFAKPAEVVSGELIILTKISGRTETKQVCSQINASWLSLHASPLWVKENP